MIVKPLKWDSDFFKKKVGEVVVNNDDKNILNSEDFDLIYLKSNRPVSINIPDFKNTFRETKLIFSKELSQNEVFKSDQIVSIFNTNFKEKDLYPLAYLSGVHSRFKKDPNFKPSEFENLYTTWIDNSFQKLIAEDIFLFSENNKILGFVSFKLNQNHGTIGLVAVQESAQGCGIGGMLIKNVEDYLVKNGIFRLDIPTQKGNILAGQFYKKIGYEIKESSEIYHYWRI